MSFKWDEQAAALFKDPDTLKILAVNDRSGQPHIIVDHTITIDQDGNILYLEFLETSLRNAALTNSLWFQHPVAVHVEKDKDAYTIQGIPIRSIVSGPLFEEYYRAALAKEETADLSTVWVIAPQTLSNEAFSYQKEKEKKEHPLVMHLDHLAK